MPRFAANLSLLFTEHDFLDRFAAAAAAGFKAVECQFPYDCVITSYSIHYTKLYENYQSDTAHGAMDEAQALYMRTRNMLLGLAVVGGVLLVVMLTSTIRRVRAGLAGIEEMAGAIALGRFDQTMPLGGNDELSGLTGHLAAMREALLTSMTSLKASEAKSQAVLRTTRDGRNNFV